MSNLGSSFYAEFKHFSGDSLNILGSVDNDELVMEKCVESTMVTLMCSLLAPKEGYTHSS